MSLDEPFPLNLFPSQVRNAILDEYDGRCPSLKEVADIPDAHWLSTPAIGPVVLRKIRALSHNEAPAPQQMTDAELLRRLAFLQKEFQAIQRAVRLELSRSSTESSLHPYPPEVPRKASTVVA
jgi:hypothetical protein